MSQSASGRAALRRAASEAQHRGAALHAVRVWRDVGWLWSMTAADVLGLRDTERSDRRILSNAIASIQAIAPQVPVVADFVVGDLYSGLLDRADGAELLVVGSGTGPESEPEDHLISPWLTAHARCPVVVVDEAGRTVHESELQPLGAATPAEPTLPSRQALGP